MSSRKRILLSCVCAAAAVSGVSFSSIAHAQAAPAAGPTNEIEELVVTAEKREQSLQDVPVAVSAFTDERREVVGINSVQDLTNFTPGLAYSTNNDRAFLRGIGRFTNNRASEGGVAMYSDGFFTSSVTAFAQSTLFLERTEALRGPQGTLYGKNAIGGALNIVSKRPTDSLYAEYRQDVGNYDYLAEEAAVSGPLGVADMRGRLAASYSHYGKGVFHNLNPNGKDEGNRGAQWTVEGQLDGKITDRFEWWAKASTTEWHTLGRGPGGRTTITYGKRDTTSANIGAFIPNSAFNFTPVLAGNICQFCFDTDDGNYINLESNTYTLNSTFHANGFDVKYITGLTYYDYRLQTDFDGIDRQAPFLLTIPARGPTTAIIPGRTVDKTFFPRTNNQYEEEVWWFSNELNFTSTGSGPLQWLLGLYQYREGSNYTLADGRFPDDPRFENPTDQTGRPVAPNPLRRQYLGTSSNVSESYATFGQLDWQATDQLKFTGGLRYTYDRKRSTEGSRLFCIYTSACPVSTLTDRPVDTTSLGSIGSVTLPNGTVVYDRSQVGGAAGIYTDPTTGIKYRQLKNHWDAVTGTLGVDWKPNSDTLVYGKFTRGYKAGGFNSGNAAWPVFVTTDKEKINAYEVGLKSTFSGRLQANASVFYYDYRDIQIPITALNPLTNSNTTQFFNLPKARNYGLELETIWQPIDHLQFLANYSYLNAKLKDACCFSDPNDPLALQPNSRATGGLKDLSGNHLPNSTPHRISVNVNYTFEDVGPGNLTASANYVWRSATYYDIFADYWNKAKSYGQTDFRMLYTDKKDKWTLIGSVKNVFEQHGSAGVSGTRINTGPNTGFVNQTVSYILPRQYSLELQLRY